MRPWLPTADCKQLLGQAILHELLAVVAFHLLVAGILVAGLHALLLCLLLVAGARGLALQTRAHELLARIAFELFVTGRRVARLHALLLGLLLLGGFLFRFLGFLFCGFLGLLFSRLFHSLGRLFH